MEVVTKKRRKVINEFLKICIATIFIAHLKERFQARKT